MPQPLPGRPQGLALFPDGAAHLDGAVIPEETPDLTRDLRHGVGGELRTVVQIKPLHCLDEADAPQLIQVVRLHAAAVVALDDGPDQAAVFRQHLLAGLVVAALRPLQQGKHLAHRLMRAEILRRMVTVVPRPGVDLTVRRSMKLSMMVKPIPLRSSPPVVNRG